MHIIVVVFISWWTVADLMLDLRSWILSNFVQGSVEVFIHSLQVNQHNLIVSTTPIGLIEYTATEDGRAADVDVRRHRTTRLLCLNLEEMKNHVGR